MYKNRGKYNNNERTRRYTTYKRDIFKTVHSIRDTKFNTVYYVLYYYNYNVYE